jgi:glyoxylase-like metal-dependent hydrolase (beta-lactamase superfamily II)
MRIHALQTGTLAIHERQRRGRGRGLWRAINTLLDSQWTQPLPIYVWVIEHPEGVIVVDTGETARASDNPGYFPRWHAYYRLAVREHVRWSDEVDSQLRTIGIPPEEVRWVVLTHLHTDHAGGLHRFPNSEILVARTEFQSAVGFRGKLRGYLPHRWPEWFAPHLVDFEPVTLGPFSGSYPITAAGDVRLVPTPGHTRGHSSVVLQGGNRILFFAGDASYSQEILLERTPDGVCTLGAGEMHARETMEQIIALAQHNELVFLPSHDPDAVRRLENHEPVFPPQPRDPIRRAPSSRADMVRPPRVLPSNDGA